MPKNDWILDVLADLKAFAAANGLAALAEQLDDTTLVAAAELAARADVARVGMDGEQSQFGPTDRGLGRHQSA